MSSSGSAGFSDIIDFSEIIGQERAVKLLKRGISSGRVAHAYLFTGPPGVGKRRAAQAFAAALNCEEREAGGAGNNDSGTGTDTYNGPCTRCPACVSIGKGTHPNLLTIGPDEKGTLKVDAVRELQRALSFRVAGGTRVAIIEAAETMVRDASGILLKTLEEPPKGSMIILLAESAGVLLPTIVSRCQRVAFSSLKPDLLTALLLKQRDLTPEDAAFAARLSGGSVSGALDVADLGLVQRRRELCQSVSELFKASPASILALAEALSKDENLGECLGYLKHLLRDMLVCMEGCAELALDKEAERIIALARDKGVALSPERLIKGYSLVEEAEFSIRPPRYGNKQLAVESLLFTLAAKTLGRPPSRAIL